MLSVKIFIIRWGVWFLMAGAVLGVGVPIVAYTVFDNRVIGNRLVGIGFMVAYGGLWLLAGIWANRSDEAHDELERRKRAGRPRRR